MSRVRVTPEQAAQLYVNRITGARDRIETGVKNVTENPCEKAANSSEKMKAGIIAAIDSGKWGRNLKAVSLEQWKEAFLTKGLDRIGSGAAAAQDKMEVFFESLFEHQNRLLADIDKLPDITLEHSIKRMTDWTRGMARFKQ